MTNVIKSWEQFCSIHSVLVYAVCVWIYWSKIAVRPRRRSMWNCFKYSEENDDCVQFMVKKGYTGVPCG